MKHLGINNYEKEAVELLINYLKDEANEFVRKCKIIQNHSGEVGEDLKISEDVLKLVLDLDKSVRNYSYQNIELKSVKTSIKDRI